MLLTDIDPLLGSTLAPLLLLAYQMRPSGEESATRERMVSAIHARPGITPTQLSEEMEMSLPTIIYHLRLLVQTGRIAVARMGRTTYCFPFLSGVPHSRRDAAAVAANEASRRVALLLMEDPYLTSTDIAARLGVSRQAVNKQILRIRKARLLHPVQDDACRLGWAPVECLRTLLMERGAPAKEDEPS